MVELHISFLAYDSLFQIGVFSILALEYLGSLESSEIGVFLIFAYALNGNFDCLALFGCTPFINLQVSKEIVNEPIKFNILRQSLN